MPDYFSKMLIPGFVIIVLVTITMFLNYRKKLLGEYSTLKVINPDDSVKDWKMFNLGILVLFLVIIGYFIGSFYNIPVSIISSTGAIILLLSGVSRKVIKISNILKGTPWSILIFVTSMYLIVYSLYNNGLNIIMSDIINFLSHKSLLLVSLIYGIISSIAACFMNNLPSVMVGAMAINDASISDSVREIITFANVIGSDVGSKITPIGSLATIMWLGILSQRGIKISFKEYTITSLKIILIPLIVVLITLILI